MFFGSSGYSLLIWKFLWIFPLAERIIPLFILLWTYSVMVLIIVAVTDLAVCELSLKFISANSEPWVLISQFEIP
jgi:hypothetical protein